MVRNRKLIFVIAGVIFALLAITIGYRLFWINARYPSPDVHTYGVDETIQVGNYTIKFSDWQWGDGSVLQELYPGYRFLPDANGNDYPTSLMRVGVAEVLISKVRDDNSSLDLTCIYFESGAWGNQFDMDLMYGINPKLEGLRVRLDEGESVKVLLPITMIDRQFDAKQWQEIDNRTFYIVLQYYPTKLQFECLAG